MKSISTLLIALALAFAFQGCAQEQEGQGFGSAAVSATVSALSVDEVARIQITVSGPNIAPDIVSELTKDAGTGEWSGVIENIPAGTDRTFLAEAFDAADVVIYSGAATGVTITDGQQVIVNIFMQQSTPPDPFSNTVPLFESLVVSSAQVAPGHDVSLAVVVSDPDPGDVLTLSWTATGGAFNVANAPSVVWTSPSTEGLYELTVAATDSTGATSTLTVAIDVQVFYGSGGASLQVDINTWPEVQNLVPTPTRIDVGETAQLELTASDPDGDVLVYAWSADCAGSFSNPGAEDPSFTLDADNGGAACTLTVALDDGRGGTNSASVAIATGPPISSEAPTPGPTIGGCTVFPADNPWNTDISGYPVHPNSDNYIDSIGRDTNLTAEFGTVYNGAPFGIPYVTVPSGQAKVPVSFTYADESDPGPYPIPPDAPIEGGPSGTGDRHVLVVETGECRLYELWNAFPEGGGTSWLAGSGAIFDLASNALRPDGWTSADAAGLPVLPGLVRYEEVVEQGEIDHALRFTVPDSQRGYIHPATHAASLNTDPNLPPMGLRVRMKASYDCSALSSEVQAICAALKRYGMFVADVGSAWFVSGAPNPNWSDENLFDLRTITGDAFEAVDTGEIIPY
jgi:hypothetical protein